MASPEPPSAPPATPRHQIVGIFFFGLLLLGLLALAIWQGLLQPSDTADIIKLLVALLAGILSYFILGALYVQAGIPGLLVRAGGGLAVFALAVWIFFFRPHSQQPLPQPAAVDTVALGCSGLRPTTPKEGALQHHVVNIALIESGNIAYVRSAAAGFRALVDQCAKAAGFTAIWQETVGPITVASPSTDSQWQRQIEYIQMRMTPDYWVPIGTQAATHLRHRMGSDWFRQSIVFAGVTDPICSNLVTQLRSRSGEPNVGGSRYGGEPSEYLARIHAYFPPRRIYFVYQLGHPQDECFALDLKNHPLLRDSTLTIVPLDHPPSLADLPDTSGVFFSWYTFEAMFEDNRIIDILKHRIVVTTTESNVLGRDLATLGVTGNDIEIGRRAAHALLKDLFGIQRLGDQDIEVPGYLVLLNCQTALARGLTFPPGMEAKATQVTAC